MSPSSRPAAEVAVDKFRRAAWQLLGIGAALALATGVVLLTWTSDKPEDTGVSLARVFFNWPPLAGIVVLVVLLKFRPEVSKVLESFAHRPIRGRGPGGVEFEAGAAQPVSVDDKPSDAVTDIASLRGEVATLRAQGELTEQQRRSLADAVERLQAQVWYWHFEYLAYQLRPHTQSILRWISALSPEVPLTSQVFDLLVLPDFPAERAAVINALQGPNLITMEGGKWISTEIAARFLAQVDARHPEFKWPANPNPPWAPRPPSSPGPPPLLDYPGSTG